MSALGGEVYDREILKGLARLGVEVQILLPAGNLVEQVPGWDLHRTARHVWNYYEYNWLFLGRLLRLSRVKSFDLLRIHSLTLGPLGWLYRRLSGRPVAAQVHHLEASRLASRINGPILRSFDRITAVSRFSRDQLVRRVHVPVERIRIVPPGVDPQLAPQPPDERLLERLGLLNRPVLFYLGSLIPRKNLLVLLDAFRAVHRGMPQARLLLGGSGPQENVLRARAAELGLSSAVIFIGPVPEAEKAAYYNIADIYVLPSQLEGFGMSAAEAMACGKPVVASNTAALPEVIEDGRTGCLADPRRPEDFAEKIGHLLRDEPLRRAMGQAGQSRVRSQYSWESAARAMKMAYEEILNVR